MNTWPRRFGPVVAEQSWQGAHGGGGPFAFQWPGTKEERDQGPRHPFQRIPSCLSYFSVTVTGQPRHLIHVFNWACVSRRLESMMAQQGCGSKNS